MINFFNNSKINFISKFKIFSFTSLFFIFLGFLFFVFKGPQLGIDFNGGTELIVHLGNYESNDAMLKNEISSSTHKTLISLINTSV